jgi:methyl-accepting chemotaxis protein
MIWTIRKKLYVGFGLAGVLLAVCLGITRWAQYRAQVTQDELRKTMGIQRDLEHLVGYINAVTSVQRAYMISGDENDITGIPAMRIDANAVATRMLAAIAGDDELKSHWDVYLTKVQARRVLVNKMNAARKNQGFEAAKALFDTGEDNRLLAEILVEFNAMQKRTSDELATQEAENSHLQSSITWVEGIVSALAFALMAMIAVMMARSIASNVNVSISLVEAMARKDLTIADGEPVSNDELAGAIAAINQMKQSMATALSEVSRSVTQVAGAGAEIEATSRQIAATTHEEQSSVAQFASSLAEMNATVKDVAEHAGNASRAADEAVASAAGGRSVMEETSSAMHRIHESVSTASTDITKLGEVTQSIGEVVRIIQEIAGQTNLLALNAAIEAARAGEQGKGFAVVAQEVRQLAERTATFTKEIASKIESVQQGADRAVNSMQQGEKVVEEGVRKFAEVSEALETIVQRIESAQQGIAMIATATTEQSAATDELTESIHRIAAEVERTVGQVDQTAMACAELARLSSDMQATVGTFHLPGEVRGSKSGPRLAQRRAA